jgi:lysozyme
MPAIRSIAPLALVCAAGCGAPTPIDNNRAAVLAPCIRSSDVRGVDVSSFPQVDIDFASLASQGYKFAFIRVSDGEILDPYASRFWTHAQQAGMLRSPYFFYYAWIDAQGQADAYIQNLNSVGGVHPGDLPPMIDVEECTFGGPSCNGAPSANGAQAIAGLKLILPQLERATGKRPIIYTNQDTWDNYMGGPNFNQYPLDLANVPASCPPAMARPWTQWVFFQDNWLHAYDTDVFNGTLQDLINYANTDVPPGGSSDPCSTTLYNGIYCGASTENGFGGGDPKTLYDCENGVTKSKTSCPNGCTVAPSGQNDYCNAGPADPCQNTQYGGLYCGASNQYGFAGGDPNTIYDCQNGKTISTIHCANGCAVAPPGQNDYCKSPPPPPDPCAHTQYGGLYCGASNQYGFAGGDPNTIYDCQNGKTISTTHCANGCAVAPPGQNDYCKSPPPPPDPCAHTQYGGYYCGSSTQYGFSGGDPNALYDCQNHVTASKTACANGCTVAPPGQNDYCRPDPCASAQYGGLYCAQSTQLGFSGGLPSYLYDCANHATASKTFCANGCVVAPPGQNDYCK